jgi:hypothetical protein
MTTTNDLLAKASPRPRTPLPWITRYGLICKRGRAPHARCAVNEDAEFIVLAVNEYESHLARIEELEKALRDQHGYYVSDYETHRNPHIPADCPVCKLLDGSK